MVNKNDIINLLHRHLSEPKESPVLNPERISSYLEHVAQHKVVIRWLICKKVVLNEIVIRQGFYSSQYPEKAPTGETILSVYRPLALYFEHYLLS